MSVGTVIFDALGAGGSVASIVALVQVGRVRTEGRVREQRMTQQVLAGRVHLLDAFERRLQSAAMEGSRQAARDALQGWQGVGAEMRGLIRSSGQSYERLSNALSYAIEAASVAIEDLAERDVRQAASRFLNLARDASVLGHEAAAAIMSRTK